MKKITTIEKVMNAKRQLNEYSKLSMEERLANFYKLKHSILRLYNIILSNGMTVLELFDFERVSSDHLFMDIELIPYFSNENNNISYIRYDLVKSLPYLCEEYEIIDESCGKYKVKSSNEPLYSIRLAVDFTLKNLAIRWYNYIPTILEFYK